MYTNFHFRTCNQFDENEQKLLVDQPSDRPIDSSNAMCPPFFEGRHKNQIHMYNDLDVGIFRGLCKPNFLIYIFYMINEIQIECRTTRTPNKCKGRLRCHGAVNILFVKDLKFAIDIYFH
jgi:hypothetical protein